MDPYIGEIRCFGFNFAPRGWVLCNGQLLSISTNTALFSLLGTMYGGDGHHHLRPSRPAGQGPARVRPGSRADQPDAGRGSAGPKS